MEAMSQSKISIFLCIFFIYFGIMFQNALYYKIYSSMKLNNTNKVSVIVNNSNAKNYFTLSDINFLKNKLKSENILAMSEIKEKVSFEGRDIDSNILGVSSSFNNFYNVNISTGSFLNESSINENEFCAVLEDRLAYKLFGNENVEGLKIKIFDKNFKIVGVIKRDSGIVQNISDDGFDKVYIPLKTLIKLDEKAKISYLQFQDLDAGTSVKSKDKAISLLDGLGKDYKQYKITDYNREKKLMEQKPLILCFILGGLCIWSFLKYLKNIFNEAGKIFITNIKKEYFIDIVKNNKRNLLIYVFKIVLTVFAILVFWRLIKFDIYIPSRYIPDEIINISYYKDIILDSIKKGINGREFLNSFIEIKFAKINMLINAFTIVTIFSIFILNSSIKGLLNISKDVTLLAAYCSKCSIAALLLITAIFMWLQVPIITGLKSLFIIWSFLFITVVVQGVKTNSI